MQELDIETLKKDIKNNGKRKTILAGLFSLCLVLFFIFLYFAPHLSEQDKKDLIRFPRGPEDLRLIHGVVEKYTEQNFFYVISGFIYLYIFLQSFAIPGPVFLSILSGALFGAIPGFILVCICATTGASFCYGLSYTLARGIVLNKFPDLLLKFNRKINANRDHLFYYMLFLRLTPLVPNVFVNLASPIVGIPLKQFALGTFIGLMPLNVIHLQTGLTLSTIDKLGANLTNIVWIALLGCLALVPTFFKKKLEEIDNKNIQEAEEKLKHQNETKKEK